MEETGIAHWPDSTAAPRPLRVTPTQALLLQTCVMHDTTNTNTLASLLSVSPETIETHFKNIGNALGVSGRFGAVMYALKANLISLSQGGADSSKRAGK